MNDYYDDCVLTQLLQLENVYQIVDINDKYSADINIFSEEYNVYNYEENKDVGYFYETDKKDLLKEILKRY